MNEELEKAIKILKNIDIGIDDNISCKECVFDNDTCCIDEEGKDCQMVAIETVLKELNKLQEKDNYYEDIQEAYNNVVKELENSISKDKIKERIEKNNKKIYGSAFISTRYENKLKMENVILQELLGDDKNGI